MKNNIDCLLIGHNEMDFSGYVKNVRKMGVNSGAYRDLNKNFIQYENKPYHASEIFNMLCSSGEKSSTPIKPLRIGENFSAAISYLGTWLDRREFSFDFVNSFQDDKEILAKKLTGNDVLSVGIITTLYITALPILEIVEFIKTHNKDAKIIIGGPFVSNQIDTMNQQEVEYLFQSIGADFYVNSSQGEATLVKILNSLKQGLPIRNVENIYYKSNKKYDSTPILKEDNKLSENMVDWRLFTDAVGDFASVRLSVSCPFSCAFCGFPEHAGAYQTAAVEDVERELNLLAEIKSVKSIQFIDDTFNVPIKRYKEILRMMIKNKYKIPWHAHLRCQFADRETIELMKESGCEGVFLGIESGSDKILKNMNKAATVEKYLRGISLLNEYDMLAYGSFIIGFPGETEE
ncbi:MAG: radical SAM protein, partial [bacterium]|nr:radical SAM protein [bacterium]